MSFRQVRISHLPGATSLFALLLCSQVLQAYALHGRVSLSAGRYSSYDITAIDPTARLSTQGDLELLEAIPNLNLRLSFEAASNALDPLDAQGPRQNQGQLLIASARYATLGGRLLLTTGRQSLFGGAAALGGAGLIIDGLSARAQLPAGLQGRSFVGLLSSPLLLRGFGDFVSGGQLRYAPPGLPMSVSLQALYSADPAENMAESIGLLGISADARPAHYLRASLQASYDVLMLELAELRSSLYFNMSERWQASLAFGHYMPSAFIRKTSMFASFSLHSYDELRVSMGYAPLGQIRSQGGLALQRDRDGELSGRAHLRSVFTGARGLTGLAELSYTSARPQGFIGPERLIQQFNSGFVSMYMSLAAPLSWRVLTQKNAGLSKSLIAAAWVQLLVFDQPVYDQLISVDAGLSLSQQICKSLTLQAWFSLNQHPLAGLDPRALIQLRYSFDLASSSTRWARGFQ